MANDRLKFIKQWMLSPRPGTLSTANFESREVLITIKRAVFERINADRRAHGLNAVAYDRLAAEVGESHCREMLAHGYVSHWNTRGLKPYHRFSFAGGTDAISENCSGSDASHDVYRSVGDVTAGVLESHAAMLGEIPPDDGHRRTILNPANTHVGIGLAFNRRAVRMTQEFVQRHVEVKSVPPATLRVGEQFLLRGRVLSPAHRAKSIAVYFEPYPRPLSLDELHRTSSYGFPNEVDYEFPVCSPGRRYTDGSTGTVVISRDGEFSCALNFKRRLPGLHTICVWLEGPGGSSIPATGLTLRVG